MNELLCPFDFLQFGPLLAVQHSANECWLVRDGLATDYDQRPLLTAYEAEAQSET